MRTLLTLAYVAGSLLAADGPHLLQQPAMNKTQIVFVFAGDLWSVERKGGAAVRLTTGRGEEYGPYFSPDGTQIAFTGEYDGNVDAFVVPAAGGVPKRLTAHPAQDVVSGWTPDGKGVLVSSLRLSYAPADRLFRVPVEGGFAEPLPFPTASKGSLSPDSAHLAYTPMPRADAVWKRYRGGRASVIWIGNMADSAVTPIPRKDANDFNPLWVGKDVYFLSDRNGPVTLFRYDTGSKQVAPVVDNKGFDLKWASAAPDGIVYEQFGSIHIYDFKSRKTQPVPITLSGDLPEVRPRMEKVSKWLSNSGISPTGVRAVFEARGDIFTVPADKGNARNLTNTQGIAERYPAWSPDGRSIAYLSDASGEYELHIAPQTGQGEVKKIDLGKPASFFYQPNWSPDSKKIAMFDKRGHLYYLEVEKGELVKIAKGTFDRSRYGFSPAWSPDSQWLAYANELRTHYFAIHVYSLVSGQSTQISDGMSDAQMPAWDASGKYLYYTASTDVGARVFGFDMSSYGRPISRSVHLVVLRKEDPSPLAPESDEEKVVEEKKAEDGKKPEEAKKAAAKVEVRIDADNIMQRTIPLPLPARNYVGIAAGKAGILYTVEVPPVVEASGGAPPTTVQRFDLAKRKAEKFADGLSALDLSASGDKMLVRMGSNWHIVPSATPFKPTEGRLKIDELEMQINPAAEWKQMYKEVLRIERDFFYDPGHHGLDVQALGERYEKYLAGMGSRGDLNYLWEEMLGELSVGHLYIRGGDSPEPRRVRGGVLGADYKVENGRYRFARILQGDNWNPQTRAPLTQPGVNVQAGDYLLAVNGRPVSASDDVDGFFEGTAGKSVVIRVGADPTGAGARDVTVVPTNSEFELRRLAWIEDNRRIVAEKTGGKIAYLYLPNTANAGYTYFNRYYYAQTDKEGAIVDERFNGGGQAADYMVETMKRQVYAYWSSREGETYSTPATLLQGPKVMLMNQWAGSGGDLLPWMFRKAGIGPLIGKRTWGGLVGIGGYPALIDGGTVTAPHFAFWSPEGKWDVENHGTAPDIEVELDPKAWREGRDTQLEKAIEVVMQLHQKNPPTAPKKPAYPVYHTKTPIATGGGGGQQ